MSLITALRIPERRFFLNRCSAVRYFGLFSSSSLLFLVAIVLPLIFLGCFNPFAPELDEDFDLSNLITEQQSPEEVLSNFRTAYTLKDSLLYSDVIDESFIFEFFDPGQQATGGLTTWGRDVDLQTTGRLLREFDVVDLVWLNTLFEESQGPFERRFVRFNLSLFGSDFNFILTGTAIFTFKLDEEDDKWRIVRWKDESDL